MVELLSYNLHSDVVAFSTTRRGGFSIGNYAEFNINGYCGDSEEAIRKIFANEPRVRVAIYDCLTVDFAKEQEAKFILRGMRCIGDFEYERNMAEANKQLGDVETVILYTRPEYAHISSTLVRDLYAYGKDVSDFVPNTLR